MPVLSHIGNHALRVMVGWRRSALVRGSFLLNVVFGLYVAVHVAAPPRLVSPRGASLPLLHDNLTSSGAGGGEGVDYATEGGAVQGGDFPGGSLDADSADLAAASSSSSSASASSEFRRAPPATPAPSLQEKVYPDLHTCHTPTLSPRPALHGDHWVLYNYVPADTQPGCNESVTYTTHADFTFLDNVVPLVERWRGPVSAAVFAPGGDFNATLATITFLRACRGLVADHVTFHLFFPADHMPSHVPLTAHVLASRTSCSQPPPYLATHTYKRAHNLTYPVNVARNIARRAAATYFVLASDVELYPSRGFIPFFMDMLRRQDASHTPAPTRRVYVLPIFEVKSGLRPPASKLALVRMLKRGSAIPFHKFVCPQCHKVPGMREWAESNATESVNVVMVAKRHPPFHHWEPIYVGTHLEPLYDERLSWEGRSDKMTQMYVMCVLDYEFHVLDNAFLVHRPGIKRHRRDRHRDQLTAKQNALLHSKITPELHTIYGKRGACYL
ncbi:beta-1,4-glucuronyltransferase 1-like isoform X1 [Penaeus japonicus]|uniref:beta-1,4-glucuronyltransferase 1-like isoform X1 n=2 Tax=Penaeus japonicus TaxID=27405 RepID=UPI001C70FC9E|nr:beta-1,4-glucuronyltransferase 1-like isoform X1 [Penaeus japonicus]XP_042868946.1 beta-1,4-glucuronyltransferase 1-like isoform X1 [Penaeus japonicus]